MEFINQAYSDLEKEKNQLESINFAVYHKMVTAKKDQNR